MQISEEQVKKYVAVYLKEYGKPIDKTRARDELTALVTYMNAVWKFQNKIHYA